MSDTFTTDDDTSGESQENPNLKLLREKAKTADEALKQVADLSRKLAVIESGIDAETPMGKLFLKAYDGEASADAIKAAAAEYGILPKGAPAEVVEDSTDSGTEVREALADASPADTGESPDPNMTARDLFNKGMADGMTEEAAAGLMVSSLAQAAMAGDPRVIQQ